MYTVQFPHFFISGNKVSFYFILFYFILIVSKLHDYYVYNSFTYIIIQ